MNRKCLIWAIIVSALTITYYVWMIHAWMHLDKSEITGNNTVPNIHEEDFSTPDYKGETRSKVKTFDASTFRFDNLKGEPPPRDAFWIKKPKYRCDSVLKINTSQGASYVVKVLDPYDGEVILMCYLPAGDRREIDIPSGTFEIRYTSGTEWFGDEEMFGAKGTYAKADRLFTFKKGAGYELTLYRVSNGNLRTSNMKREDF